MGKLEGKVAVITGGATGIGRAAAKRFIEEGAFVFIFGRRQGALDAAVADLGPNARAVKGSVSDLADLDRLYAAVKAERGTLDIVFANAGAGSQLRLGEITAEHIDETFDTNVKGTIFTVQKALPLMGEGGSIILTGSSAGATGAPGMTAYSASKAAVRNLADLGGGPEGHGHPGERAVTWGDGDAPRDRRVDAFLRSLLKTSTTLRVTTWRDRRAKSALRSDGIVIARSHRASKTPVSRRAIATKQSRIRGRLTFPWIASP